MLRDGPYRLLVLAQVGYSISIMILIFALPVYAVEVLDLPGWVGGVVFTVNCVMVGFGQGLVVNALTGHVRYRVLLLAQATFATSYVVFLLASELSVWVATAVVVVGVHGLHAGRADGRAGAQRAGGRGGARAPARPLPLDDPARLEPQRHGRAAALRLAARQRPSLAVAGHARHLRWSADAGHRLLGRVLPQAGQPVTNRAAESAGRPRAPTGHPLVTPVGDR